MYKICNEEKHKIEVFNDLNQNETGKEGYLETLKMRNIKTHLCREILNKQLYKEKSEKMKGDGNHNYGKSFSKETKKKMSCSIRDKKGGISDEMIVKVRELIEKGYKNIEIQELLSLHRHTVTRIKNGDLVCRNEEKVKKSTSLTQEELNIKRRKIRLDEMFIVIDKSIAGDKPTAILEYLDQMRVKNNIKNDLTIDIIKNIRRDISKGKLPFYKSEVSKELFERYEDMIMKRYGEEVC